MDRTDGGWGGGNITAPGTRQKKTADAPDSSLETGQGGAVMGSPLDVSFLL